MPLTGAPAWSVSAPQQRRPLASPSAEGRIGSSTSGTFDVGQAGGGQAGGGVGGGLGATTGQVGAGANDLLNLYNSYMAGQAPTIAGLQGQNALAGARLGLEGQDYAAQRGFAQRDYNLGMAGNQLDYANLGTERDLNNLKMSDLPLQRQGIGIDRQGIGVTQDYTNKMRGYAGDTLSQQLYDALRQGVYRTVQNNSQATGNGAWYAPMRQFENANIYGDTMNAGNQARTGYAKQVAGFDRDDANARLDMQRLDVKEKGIGNDEQRVQIANRQLDIQAQRLGLNAQQMQLALEKGLQNLGMSNAMSVNQIMSAMASNNAQVQQMAMNAMNQALSAAGLSGLGTRGLGSVTSQVYPYSGGLGSQVRL